MEQKSEAIKDLPDPQKMETAPDELLAPASLGGSMLDVESDDSEDEEAPEIEEKGGPDITLTSLAERAEDLGEDMEERNEWQRAVNDSEEQESEVDAISEVEEETVAEIEDEE